MAIPGKHVVIDLHILQPVMGGDDQSMGLAMGDEVVRDQIIVTVHIKSMIQIAVSQPEAGRPAVVMDGIGDPLVAIAVVGFVDSIVSIRSCWVSIVTVMVDMVVYDLVVAPISGDSGTVCIANFKTIDNVITAADI